jgi:hypothetical protein
MNKLPHLLLLFFAVPCALAGCNAQTNNPKQNTSDEEKKPSENYKEGSDYLLFERARMLDRTGFTEPQEAYSVLLPKGWKTEGEIVWNSPGSSCAGTFSWLKAKSADGKYSFEMYPDALYTWNSNPELMQFNQNNGSSSPNCGFREPMDAEQYLRNVFALEELGNAEIIKVEPAPSVIAQMQQSNEEARRELMQYGAGQMQFNQTALNADIRWPDGKEGLVVFGVTTLEMDVPNNYNGTYNKIYTTQVVKRIVFTYPKGEKEHAKNQFSVVMGSFRTNPLWSDAVKNFWKEVRQQSHIAHVGKIKMIDDQTRAMGEAAIRSGEARLKSMDMDLRSWEQSQNSQDRMHTNFIKTIREVENYQDATGKIELSSGYDHAWSRGDGSTFIMSNNPNFDPASVFQDQNWSEMKKVD